MKNINKIFGVALTMLLLLCAASTEAKPKQTKIYIFGVSVNFTDSITYMTDIQTLDQAYIETKTGFLYDRSIYSQQLQVWVETAKNQPYTTCTVFFSDSKSKLEKKFKKIQSKYYKDQSTIVKHLEAGEFKFRTIEWTEHERL